MGCATSTECLSDRRPLGGRYKQPPRPVEPDNARRRQDLDDDPDEPSEVQTRYTAAAARRRYAVARDRADVALVDQLERTRSAASSQSARAQARPCINNIGSYSAYDDSACDSTEPALRSDADDEDPSADSALALLCRAHSHSHAPTSNAGSVGASPGIAANVFDILNSDSDDDADFTGDVPSLPNAATPHTSSPAHPAAVLDALLPGTIPCDDESEDDAAGACFPEAFAPTFLCHIGEFATPKTYHHGASAQSPLVTLRDKIYSTEAPPPSPSRRPQPRPLLTRAKPAFGGSRVRRR
mmetsp:Transcript_46336/g.142946  ORF Transcript_46336/g.142946 Transcript_46336/m.142946 type:complete len:298 (-) Transcript_46336:630-1523(-)